MTSTGFKDKFGREIKVGDLVVYPVRRQSSTFLNDARITGALAGALTGVNAKGNTVTLRIPKRCAIVEV